MRYPTDYLLQSTYPIKCYSGFSDGFSGWYAVSNRRKCNDLCYWEVIDNSDDSSETAVGGYSPTNVADPHQATLLPTINSTSSWRCALDVASDTSVWSDIESKLTKPGYFGPQFPYLQCAQGAGEVLEANADIVAKSEGMWWSLTIVGSVLVLLQFVQLLLVALRTRLRSQSVERSDGTSHSYRAVRQMHPLQKEGERVDESVEIRVATNNDVGEHETRESEFEDESLTDDEGLSIVAEQTRMQETIPSSFLVSGPQCWYCCRAYNIDCFLD